MKKNFTPAELLAAIRAAGAEPYIGPGGIAKVRNKDRIPPELLKEARERLPELLAVLQDEAEALRAELAAALERWERGCRWFAEDPRRAGNDRAFERLGAAGGDVLAALESLEVLAPGDPALDDARRRLDAEGLRTTRAAG
jgi:hypothetical protein